jgi:MinD-like ATPase involved in chromosome partitioning or flagellar assembly
VPFSSSMVQGGDEGTPLVVSHPESSAAKALVALAARIASS